MTQVLISKELEKIKVGEKILIPLEQYEEILRDIELEYQIELAEAIALEEERQLDAELEEQEKLLEAIALEEQRQIDAWDAYLDSLNQAEHIDITPTNFSITEKEVFIEEVEEITLGPVKTLIFGRNIGTKGVVVSETQWQSFLADSISARFPEGYTKVNTEGVWKGGKEKSNAILFACPDTPENKDKLVQIVQEYCSKFNQDAVLKINADGVGSLLQIKQGEDNA